MTPFDSTYAGGICGVAPNAFACHDGFVLKIEGLFSGNPVPAIGLLSPASADAGGAGFTLTVQGSGFVTGAEVRWNGSPRTTTFVNASELTALITAADIAIPGEAQISVFTPAPGGGISNEMTFTISNPLLPQFTAAGLVNGASFGGPPPAAGAIVSLFGINLASGEAFATDLPLPTTLLGTTVQLNGIAVALFYVGENQINFLIPWELIGQLGATLTVTTAQGTSQPVAVNLSLFAPGIFTTNSQGTGQGAILISNTPDLAAPTDSIPGRTSRPVRRGEFITIFCTGLGNVSNPPASGAPAGSDPLSQTLTAPTVTIGGVPATVSFSGLAPGFVGLYQIDVEVPAGAPSGSAVEVRVTIGGVAANIATIAVE